MRGATTRPAKDSTSLPLQTRAVGPVSASSAPSPFPMRPAATQRIQPVRIGSGTPLDSRVERASRVPRASAQIARVEGHSPRRSVRSLVATPRDSRATTVTDRANPSIWSNGVRAKPFGRMPFRIAQLRGRACRNEASGRFVGWDGVASRQYFPYILRCCDGRLYVGQTSDLAARVAAHNDGKGAAFTAARRPVSLIYFEGYSSRREAMERELQVKQRSAAKKSALVAGDLEQVHRSSQCRQRRCK